MATEYLHFKKVQDLPRLPLEARLDLTYRCNNNCRHCWLRIPSQDNESEKELSFAQIIKIFTEARQMGCRSWLISGGEPMLRPDFAEIFDYISANSGFYSLNTNATLITPKIAKLLTRKGIKMVALYGATAEVHDYITRNPGSFAQAMQGIAYLKEAGAGFTVQLIPMRDNYHQFKEMVRLAKALSRNWRLGASWLYLSARADSIKNKSIIQERLSPQQLLELEQPDLSYEERVNEERLCNGNFIEDDYHFSYCISRRRSFHIDPYGQASFCNLIKDISFRYDLRNGDFAQFWDEFIPSLAEKVKVTKKYLRNCGSCQLRQDCKWCPALGFLEHRSFDAKVDYLCAVAKENRKFKDNFKKAHRRYYRIADITVEVESQLAITEDTFHSKFRCFKTDNPGKDTVKIRHYFSLPDLNGHDLGKEVYRKAPWLIYQKQDTWIYLSIASNSQDQAFSRVAVFNHDHTRVRIYHSKENLFLGGGLPSLTLFATDQLLLARVLADKQGCYLHSCGLNFQGKGLLFVGHSQAGKSTIATMLKTKAEILCDDRVIVRKCPEGFKIYGTWSHGDVAEVSPKSASLEAIFFLEKSENNRLVPLEDKKEIIRRLLGCLIRPLVTIDWWEKMLSLIGKMVNEVPCYLLYFDKSGEVVDLLQEFLEKEKQVAVLDTNTTTF